MNLLQYLAFIFMAQTVQANSIGLRLSTPNNNTRTDEQSNEQRRLSAGDNDHFVTKKHKMVSSIETEESLATNIDSLTSAGNLLRNVTSPKFDAAPLTRVKRGRSPRKKKCNSLKSRPCKNGKGKSARKWGKRKRKRCRKKGKGRKKGCKNQRVTPKPPPINSETILSPGRGNCIRTIECPVDHCCARHHNVKICKPMKKENDTCNRPRHKERRNVDQFAMCQCEEGLHCKKSRENSRLYTCQRKT